MDNVDRMYRHLVRTIRTRHPQYLTQSFDVASLVQTILPYRLHRRELGLETNEDYEIAMTTLLSGARDYLIVDDRMREALAMELASPNPDPSAFKKFASAAVALSPTAVRSLDAGPDDTSTPLRPVAVPVEPEPRQPSVTAPPAPPAPGAPAATAPRVPRPVPPPPRPSAATTSLSGTKAIIPEPGERCRACSEVLPPGRPITFCPHCGQNVTTQNCQACGSELEVGWKFCPTCGRATGA